MAVQFNLLPEVKYQYLKAKHLQRLITVTSVVVASACVALLVVLVLFVYVFRQHHINDLTSDIRTNASEIQSVKGLNKILTVQNQLETLPDLYSKNPQTSRAFKYIVKLTPPNVTVGDMSLDFSQNTMTIKGAAPALSNINSYTDSLKKATYNNKTSGDKDMPAFDNVTLNSFGRSDDGANYEISLSFDPVLFQASSEVNLRVPRTTNLPNVPGVNGKVFKALPDKQVEDK